MTVVKYDVDMVAKLVGVVFSGDVVWGASVGDSAPPDPDMPKAASDPAKSGDLWAMVTDVERAFNIVSLREARVVYARCVLDESTDVAGRRLGIPARTLSRVYESGLDRMARWLNGDKEVALSWKQELHDIRFGATTHAPQERVAA